MTIYESNTGLVCPLHPIGNGNMLVYLSGVSIWSMQCSYSAPSLLSLTPDSRGGYYESRSERIAGSITHLHQMRYTVQGLQANEKGEYDHPADLIITDRIAEKEGVFIRTLEGDAPMCWSVSLPGYVRSAMVRDYWLIHCEASALFCTAPAGVDDGNGIPLGEEHSLTLYLFGALHFSADGQQIIFDGGKGYMLFVDSRDPTASLRLADQTLVQIGQGTEPAECAIFRKTVEYWNELLAPIEPLVNDAATRLSEQYADVCAERLSARIEDAVCALLSMQSATGIIVADQWHSFGKASDLPILTAALLKLGQRDCAWRMITRWGEMIGSSIDEEGAGIPIGLSASEPNQPVFNSSDASATASFLLSANLLIDSSEKTASNEMIEKLLKKMRKAFTLTMNGICDGMLPFSGNEPCFEYGILSRDCIFHGSAIATATALKAAEDYIAYCERTGRKIARESERYLKICRAMRARFDEHFAGSALYVLNSPALEEKTRRPRFIRGFCPRCASESAYPQFTLLELDHASRYRCRKCLSVRYEQGWIPSKLQAPIESLDATSYIAYWLDGLSAQKALDQAILLYRNNLDDNSLPLRSGMTDAMLTAAAKRSDSIDKGIFLQALIESACLNEDPRLELGALPSEMTTGSDMKGAMSSSASIAALLLALLD